MNPPKSARNAALVRLRNRGTPWSALASRFGISEATACKIYRRDNSAEAVYEAKHGFIQDALANYRRYCEATQ